MISVRAKPRLEILAFHRIMAGGENYFIPPMAMSRVTFEHLLVKLAGNFRFLELGEAVAALQAETLTQNALALTFDDGYYDNCTVAREFLAHKGFPATFFLPIKQLDTAAPYWWDYLKYIADRDQARFWHWLETNRPQFQPLLPKDPGQSGTAEADRCCRQLVRSLNGLSRVDRAAFLASVEKEFGPYRGDKLLMSWDDARTLCDQGFNVGSHSLSHEPLTDLGDHEAATEIEQSRIALTERVGMAVSGFCYPRGAHSTRLAKVAQRAGYAYAVTTRHGANPPGSDVFVLRRRTMADFHGVRANFPVLAHRLELTTLLDRYLAMRRSG